MLRFKNPGAYPPGGWRFTQVEIGWSAPQPLVDSVGVLSQKIRQLRLNNLTLKRLNYPTDLEVIALEVITYNCALNPKLCMDTEAPLFPKKQTDSPSGGCGSCGR